MPKMKSNRGAKKRFKLSASGKIKHKRNYKSHKLSKKTTKRKRELRKFKYVHESDAPRVKAMLLDS